MTHFADDLFLGGVTPSGSAHGTTASGNPTIQMGAGPMGRITYVNMVPLTKGTANVAALQHMTSGTALTLAAGTGVTATTAPDGSGRTVYAFDVARAVAITSDASISGVTFTIVGFDTYGVQMSQARAGGGSATTVNTTKAFKSILSVTPNATDGTNNVSIGSSDIFGLPFALTSIGCVTSVKWDEVLAADAGTVVAAVTTDPATTTTGDVRGTYTPSSAANGTRRLVMAMHLTAAQCGFNATYAALWGVTQA